jgi:hypothetical protein
MKRDKIILFCLQQGWYMSISSKLLETVNSLKENSEFILITKDVTDCKLKSDLPDHYNISYGITVCLDRLRRSYELEGPVIFSSDMVDLLEDIHADHIRALNIALHIYFLNSLPLEELDYENCKSK